MWLTISYIRELKLVEQKRPSSMEQRDLVISNWDVLTMCTKMNVASTPRHGNQFAVVLCTMRIVFYLLNQLQNAISKRAPEWFTIELINCLRIELFSMLASFFHRSATMEWRTQKQSIATKLYSCPNAMPYKVYLQNSCRLFWQCVYVLCML